jgi:hypothetical protein
VSTSVLRPVTVPPVLCMHPSVVRRVDNGPTRLQILIEVTDLVLCRRISVSCGVAYGLWCFRFRTFARVRTVCSDMAFVCTCARNSHNNAAISCTIIVSTRVR